MCLYIIIVQILVINGAKTGTVRSFWNIINTEKEQPADLDCFEYWTNLSTRKFNSIKMMHFEARVRAENVELKPGNDRRRK